MVMETIHRNRGGMATLALLLVLAIINSKDLIAQQIPHYTQHMFNNYLTNPAVAGTLNFYQMRANSRYQWIGINDAPQTISMSVWGPLTKKDMGWGAYIYNDITGPTSRTCALGSYAYNLQLNRSGLRISGGLSFGLMQYKFDDSKASYGENGDPRDPAIVGKSVITPDAALGVYLYTSKYNVGLSVQQLFGQKLRMNKENIEDSRLKQHLLLSGGIWENLNRYTEVEVSSLIKYMFSSPMQVELNGKVTYRRQFWGGLSFRWRDAISFLVGYNYKNKYMFGYSFDWSLLGISRYNAGTHEVMVGVMFDKIK